MCRSKLASLMEACGFVPAQEHPAVDWATVEVEWSIFRIGDPAPAARLGWEEELATRLEFSGLCAERDVDLPELFCCRRLPCPNHSEAD